MRSEVPRKQRRSGHYCSLLLLAILTTGKAGLAQTVFTSGLVRFEAFNLSDRDIQQRDVATLTSHPSFPNSPSLVRYIRGLTTTYAYPDSRHDNYGSRMTGVFIPPVSGNYIFYLRSDDTSQLWFNPNGPDEGGKVMIAEEQECCRLFSANASAAIALTAGQHYWIETLHREGPEADYCEVAYKLENDPADPDFLLPIGAEHLGVYTNATTTSISSAPDRSVLIVLPSNVSNDLEYGEDFSSGGGGLDVQADPAEAPWTYDSDRQVWQASAPQGCVQAGYTNLLTPSVTLSRGGDVYLRLRHRYAFEWHFVPNDGGQIRLSVNGGPYTSLPTSSFLANGYTGTLGAGSPLAGQVSFIGGTETHGVGLYTTTVARLGTFEPGDTLVLEFMAAWDACSRGQYPNWEIKQIELAHSVARIAVDATATRGGQPYSPVAYDWQKNPGTGFVDAGSTESVLWLVPSALDDLTVFRALLTIPGSSTLSNSVTLRVTRKPDCNIGGPYTATCAVDRPGLSAALDASGSSDPDGDVLTYLWTSNEPGVTFADPTAAKTTAWFGAGYQPAVNSTITLQLTDSLGATTVCSTTVDTSLSQQPPTVTLNGAESQTIDCNASAPNEYAEAGATGLDACDRAVDVTINGTVDTQARGVYGLSYVAVDVFGNQSVPATRQVTVNAAPLELANLPDDAIAECDATGGLLASGSAGSAFLNAPTAENNCITGATVVNDAPAVLPLGTNVVEWTIWDNAPTTLSATRTITVRDTTAPTLDGCPALRIAGGRDCTIALPDLGGALPVNDTCTARNDLVITQDPPAGTPLATGVYPITFTIADHGTPPNVVTCSTTVEVAEAPIITCPADVQLTMGDPFAVENLQPATAVSGCTTPHVSAAITSDSPSTCPIERVVEVTWTAANDDGTSSSCVQTVSFEAQDTNGDGSPDCVEASRPAPLPDCGSGVCGTGGGLSLAATLSGMSLLRLGRRRKRLCHDRL